jgi:membrane protease YdiL (CAAX protease family)
VKTSGEGVKRHRSASLHALSALSAAAFFLLFLGRRGGPLDFWWRFASTIVVLVTLSAILDRRFVSSLASDFDEGGGKKALLGCLSALALYLIFFTGDFILRALLPPSGRMISDIYGLGEGQSAVKIVLLILVIGPGEELFWRGFLQGGYARRYGRLPALVLSTTLYTLVHLGSGNAVLILAAFVGGLFWGSLFSWKRSMIVNMTSHTIWDIAAFVLFPFAF